MSFEVLKELEILFGLALVIVVLFRRFRLPSIIGFLVSGILAGPHVLGLISNPHQVEQLAELGVVLLLFTIGIEFSLKELMRIRHLVLLGGGLQVGLTILAIAVLGAAFGYPMGQSVFFGFLVALSSTAILMKLLMDSGEMDTPHGKMSMGVLIFQDLCVVPLMLFTPFLAGAGSGFTGMLAVSAKAAVVILAAHYGARFLVPWIFSQVVRSRSRELFILTIIFIGFGTAWLTAQVGLSLALGAFIAGLAISESEYSHQALGDIIPFRDAFISLFFISVGMLLDPAIIIEYPLQIVSIVITLILIKVLITSGAVFSLGVPMRIALMSGLCLAQVGEFSFVLCQSGLKYGLLTPDLYQIFLASSIATMGLTPFCMKIAPAVAGRVVELFPQSFTRGRGALARNDRKTSLSDHVIIVGYGLNGRNLAKVLTHLKIAHHVVETNPFTVKAEKKKGNPIIFGDGSNAEILSHAGIERARIIVIAISDAASSRRIADQARRQNPGVHIIVRTRYIAEMEPLYGLGVNEVIPEEFETSIEILSRVLRRYLLTHDEIERHISEVRSDSYDMFRSMSRRHSTAVGISGFLSGAEIGTFRLGAGSPLVGKSLREGVLRERSGATLLMIKRGDLVVPNPDPVWELQEGDVVLIMGTSDQLAAAAGLFEHSV
jgi:CPA2 family monovalent cation:H+ antiporter-2